MNNGSIGLFDSGIGGVSVLNELIKKMPNENYIYLSDSANNPYGDKEHNELFNICKKNITELIKKNCKVIVIACNTASMRVGDELRKFFKDTIIFGIEPAYKMIYDNEYEKTTLIMATKGTVESEKFKKLFSQYNNKKTYILPCPGLADIIEEENHEKIRIYLKDNLSRYKGIVEDVVIGCTHYFFIEDEIKKVLGNVKFFYGANGVAENVYRVLNKNNLLNNNDKCNIEFLDTSNLEQKKDRFRRLLTHY